MSFVCSLRANDFHHTPAAALYAPAVVHIEQRTASQQLVDAIAGGDLSFEHMLRQIQGRAARGMLAWIGLLRAGATSARTRHRCASTPHACPAPQPCLCRGPEFGLLHAPSADYVRR